MSYLIDGFNLIYKFPELEEHMLLDRLDRARTGLLARLQLFMKIKKYKIRVVFDGKKNPSRETRSETIAGIDVYYSLDYSADFLIKEFIKKDPNPRMTTVVTSDRDIIAYIKRFKAQSIMSEKFADLMEKTFAELSDSVEPEKDENPAMTDEELSFWEQQFRERR